MNAISLVNNGVVGQLLAGVGETVRLRLLTRHHQTDAQLDALGIEQCEADLTAGPMDLVLFAGVTRYFWVMSVVEHLTSLASRILQAARQAGVNYIVRHSEASANQGRIQLSRWHAETNGQLARSGIAYTILRPASLMQNLYRDQQTIPAQDRVQAATGDGQQAYTVVRAP